MCLLCVSHVLVVFLTVCVQCVGSVCLYIVTGVVTLHDVLSVCERRVNQCWLIVVFPPVGYADMLGSNGAWRHKANLTTDNNLSKTGVWSVAWPFNFDRRKDTVSNRILTCCHLCVVVLSALLWVTALAMCRMHCIRCHSAVSINTVAVFQPNDSVHTVGMLEPVLFDGGRASHLAWWSLWRLIVLVVLFGVLMVDSGGGGYFGW